MPTGETCLSTTCSSITVGTGTEVDTEEGRETQMETDRKRRIGGQTDGSGKRVIGCMSISVCLSVYLSVSLSVCVRACVCGWSSIIGDAVRGL